MRTKEFLEKLYSKINDNVELTKEQEKHIIDYLNIKENKKWKPEFKEIYWWIFDGSIVYTSFVNEILDEFRLSIGNYFKTKEEAEFRLEQIKVYSELKNFADENNKEIDLLKGENLYRIEYSTCSKRLDVSDYIMLDIGQIYFSSEKLAYQAIEKVGADRIKKYLFGVE